ncbi:hypothetical protein [Legionella cardiaca]|uniref:Uncharacterized protein n=1 Tax=Legionella cardiaca TaxID=1071983 RepID=A0ABY8AT41_9GAMM|nr:hypothetical protein [Legionella cardiaca]WED42486.1 hypothetical protein PXX05_11245 [Legionella cardiaca]
MTYEYQRSDFTCNNPEYFMAVCQYKTHSYVMVGVRDSKTGEQLILNSIGRKGGFFGTNLTNELMPNREQSIGIQAFTITKDQYGEFVHFLEEMLKVGKSNATVLAVPSEWLPNEKPNDNNDNVSFSWVNLKPTGFITKSEKGDVYDASKIQQGIALNNNCRTTAKYLTKTTMTAESLPNVPSFYRSSLPFKAILSQGKISTPLFIYPPPPPAIQDPEMKKQWEVLKKIYARIDKIAKSSSDDNSKSSHEKFNSLKGLYQTQYNKLVGKQSSLKELMDDINQYVLQEKSVIDDKRSFMGRFFKFKTATRKMFNEIQEECSKIKPK